VDHRDRAVRAHLHRGQIYEFTEFYREGLALKTNVFGSSFFVLTGIHGAT